LRNSGEEKNCIGSAKGCFFIVFCLGLDINITMKNSQTTRLALVLGGVVLVAYLMSNYSSTKATVGEGLEQVKGALGVQGPLSDSGPYGKPDYSGGGNAQPVEQVQGRHPSSQSTYSESKLSADELLPKGGLGASWAAVNPAGMGDLKGQNFLDAGYHTNTAIAGVSQTNRNASWDVRSEPPNPQTKVGPFLNTTIESNPFKRGLDA
jgi:hypothetical protein